jgi:putative acetyltransferase
MAHVEPAIFPEHAAIVTELWRAFIADSPVDLSYQNNAAELVDLPGRYAAPGGCVLLAWQEDAPVGVVAMRAAGPGVCEMKRLFVRPAVREQAVGRTLVERLIVAAREAGYREMRLDVQARSRAARTLYRSMGFAPAPPVSFNPVAGAAFLGLRL